MNKLEKLAILGVASFGIAITPTCCGQYGGSAGTAIDKLFDIPARAINYTNGGSLTAPTLENALPYLAGGTIALGLLIGGIAYLLKD